MDILKDFHGPNAGYVLELYERYQRDPASVDPATRAIFDNWTPRWTSGGNGHAAVAEPPAALTAGMAPEKIAGIVNMAQAIRMYGHLGANLDPLGSPPPDDPWLAPDFYGLTDEDLQQISSEIIGAPFCGELKSAGEAVAALRKVYAGSIGYDYGHIHNPAERQWLRQSAECGAFRPPEKPVDALWLLDRLTRVEAFETFLHRIFPGKTRFSIEGVDTLVPMLDEIIGDAAQAGICSVLIGMAHRGRLNVLAHILDKPYAQILTEFKDPVGHFPTRDEMGWTGDVKYHKGAEHSVRDGRQVELVVAMPPNPSHLEHIDPVLVGMARAAGSQVDEPGAPRFGPNASLPVLIHGDASFPGQGIVAETLNLSQLQGYRVGGTIHIITNNQLGYTTPPGNGRSTLYASDLAKGFEIPILHVNADDPVACLEAARTAFAYRQEFGKDFLIDLIGYRRYGHNEGDEPSFTQPLMYEKVKQHPTVRARWAERLVEEGLVGTNQPEEQLQQVLHELQEGFEQLEPEKELEEEPVLEPPPRGAAANVQSGVPLDQLRQLNEALLRLPEGFQPHRKIERSMERRRQVFDDPQARTIDWATAEELAMASILADGIPIRLTGEDVARGTFSQRHAVFHDTANGSVHIPLQNFPQARAAFEVLNSPLSENAVLGYEFGYNIQAPRRLVIWEAQYGDFINTAQAIIDEFIVSARAKWEQTPSLVLLLPHGQEGQGPDHSSGRPERFLELAADTNLRLANCTTAAQYFHLLRRQSRLLETDPLPLIILTPKSLLRHPQVASAPQDLTQGRFYRVLDDPEASKQPEEVRRLVLCSGKIFVDLTSSEQRQQRPDVAIVRLEQLYPFPAAALQPLLDQYNRATEIYWVQEEPENMGAWTFIRPRLEALLDGRLPLHGITRSDSASPGEGSTSRHTLEQQRIINEAFGRVPEKARS